MMGRAALYEPIDNRASARITVATTTTRSKRLMLLNPDARLGADGYYEV